MFSIGSFISNFVLIGYLVVAVSVTGSLHIKEQIKNFLRLTLPSFWHICTISDKIKSFQKLLLLTPNQKLYFVDYPRILENSVWLSLE